MKIINFSVNRKRMEGTPRDRVVEGGGRLVFAWGVENAPGQRQAAYRLTLACDGSNVYDSGWVETDAQECAVSGLAVPSGARVDAALVVRDDTGAESEKGIQSFYPVNVEWTAKWMTAPEDANLRTVYCRREFSVKGEIRRAVLYACGLGYRKRIRFPAEIVLIGSSRGLRPSRAHPEAEGTDSPPHHPFSDSAEILRISGRGICKEAIFSPGGKPPLRKNQRPRPTRRSPASIGSREGSHPLELSGGCSFEGLVSDDTGCSFDDFCFRRRGTWCPGPE